MAEKRKAIWAIGMMSGTSLDGIDAALIKTDGVEIVEMGPHVTVPFEVGLYEQLYEAVHMRGDIWEVEHQLTLMHADVVKLFLEEAGLSPHDVAVIGMHGQTVAHRPKQSISTQLGNGALLAAKTRIDVICDFRRRDVAAGGEGAPLVPLFQAAMCKTMDLPLAVVNIGGISNVTWVGKSEAEAEGTMAHDIFAFDCGPGNALLNDWVRQYTGAAYDENGALAATGRVDVAIIEDFMKHDYFEQTPPKSLDRTDFDLQAIAHLSPQDGAATLTAMTAHGIARAVEFFPVPPRHWLITGGGRHNDTLMGMLAELLPDVRPVETVDWDGDALEAQAFGFLAVRSLYGLPITLPTTTGASHAVTGGAFYRAGFYAPD